MASWSALAVYIQVQIEMGMETQVQSIHEKIATAPVRAFERPTEALAKLLYGKSMEIQVASLRDARLGLVGVVALCAASGELVHGIGEVVLQSLFPGIFALNDH